MSSTSPPSSPPPLPALPPPPPPLPDIPMLIGMPIGVALSIMLCLVFAGYCCYLKAGPKGKGKGEGKGKGSKDGQAPVFLPTKKPSSSAVTNSSTFAVEDGLKFSAAAEAAAAEAALAATAAAEADAERLREHAEREQREKAMKPDANNEEASGWLSTFRMFVAEKTSPHSGRAADELEAGGSNSTYRAPLPGFVEGFFSIFSPTQEPAASALSATPASISPPFASLSPPDGNAVRARMRARRQMTLGGSSMAIDESSEYSSPEADTSQATRPRLSEVDVNDKAVNA
eukprot:jgi/Chrpa1/8577/Chrysochromulina_OHIO_Genome00016681-RA